jgi:hypothetical protein
MRHRVPFTGIDPSDIIRGHVHRYPEEVAVALSAEVLAEWREAERVLSVLPDDAPERPAILAAAEGLRQLYQYVAFDLTTSTATKIAQARARIDETHALLKSVGKER